MSGVTDLLTPWADAMEATARRMQRASRRANGLPLHRANVPLDSWPVCKCAGHPRRCPWCSPTSYALHAAKHRAGAA